MGYFDYDGVFHVTPGSFPRQLAKSVLHLCRQVTNKQILWLHRSRLGKRVKINSDDYKDYLGLQLARTFSKRNVPLQFRSKEFIDIIANHIDLANCKVLCVGCRNTAEINYFVACGARSVVGIDLYSESDRILVMDMHQMSFPDEEFDLIYSSHSLEHALYPDRAAQEFVRVLRSGGHIAIEIPIQFQTRGSDLHDFKSAETVANLFGSAVDNVILSQNLTLGGEGQEGRQATARVIFKSGVKHGGRQTP